MRRTSAGLLCFVVGLVIGSVVLAGAFGLPSARSAGTAPSGPAATFGAEQLSAARTSLGGAIDPAGLLTAGVGAHAAPGGAVPDSGAAYQWHLAAPLPGQPSPRYFADLTWDAADGYVLMYGGYYPATGYVFSDTWTYVNGTWTNITTSVSGTPPPEWASGFAYDPSDHQVLLMGGNGHGFVENDYVWAYSDKTWTNLTTSAGPGPSTRVAPAMSTDSVTGGVLLFGGILNGGWDSDTWTFASDHWANVTTTAGVPARFPAGAYLSDDPAGPGPLLFGTASENVSARAPFFAGTYVFKAGVWTNLTGVNPNAPSVAPNSFGANVGYLPALGAVVLFAGGLSNTSGGSSFGPFTWYYQDGAWTNATVATGPNPNFVIAGNGFVTPYDSAFEVFSGLSFALSSLSDETWVLTGQLAATVSASATVVDAGGSVTFTGASAYGIGGFTAAWTFGDGGSASGWSVSHPFATAGVYVVTLTVTDLLGDVASASVAVQVNPAPTVGLLAPVGSPTAGSPVGFAALPHGGTPPFTFAWNLGNGATSGAAAPSTTYTAAGTYTVTVTLTDALGATATNTTTVTIATAPSSGGSPSLTSGTGLLLLIAVIALLVVAVILGVLLLRKGGGSRPPPAPYAPAATAPASPPPPGAAGPPPGVG